MAKAERLFRLVLLLQRGRVTTAFDLARELGVSERTIYRDVQSLVLAGVPVVGEPGIGYMLRRKTSLPPMMFTPDEARALALGARMVSAWGDANLEAAAHGVLEKVRATAPERLRADLDDPTLVVPGFHVDPAVRDSLGLLRKCVVEQRKVRMRYTRADGMTTARTVRPLGMVYWGSIWSLCAWCEKRKAFRNFRVDRMNDVHALGTTFSATDKISLEAFFRAVGGEE